MVLYILYINIIKLTVKYKLNKSAKLIFIKGIIKLGTIFKCTSNKISHEDITDRKRKINVKDTRTFQIGNTRAISILSLGFKCLTRFLGLAPELSEE